MTVYHNGIKYIQLVLIQINIDFMNPFAEVGWSFLLMD